jgi:fumarylacetoacetate (FAA) hydrolase
LKLASLASGGRDGALVVVSRDLGRAVHAPVGIPTLQRALDEWERCAPLLAQLSEKLEAGAALGAFPLDPARLAAPLPRAFQWVDGSAYLSHVERVRRARGAALPPELETRPLLYQGGSDGFLGPLQPIAVEREEWGVDFEAEVAVITGDVAMGATPERAGRQIRLMMLANDVSLRNLIPAELARGFGFFQSKPASAFSPVALTPDELGSAWDGARVHLPLVSSLNGQLFGRPEAALDMHFDFPTLLAHAARTRALGAGTIVGSGAVSNRDPGRGASCIAERRGLEIIETGEASTPFLRFGDRIRIEMLDREGRSPFGAIEQEVVRYPSP